MSDELSPVEVRAERFLTSTDSMGMHMTTRFLPAVMGLLAGIVAAFTGLYLWSETAWQWLAMVAAYIQVLLLFGIAYVFVRRERFAVAGFLVAVGVNVAGVVGAVALEGWLPISAMMGFAAVILGTAIAGLEHSSAFIILTGFGFVLDTWLADIGVVTKLVPPDWVRSGFWVVYAMIALAVTAMFLAHRSRRSDRAADRLREMLGHLGESRRSREIVEARWERCQRRLEATAGAVRSVCARLDPEGLFSELVMQVSETFDAYHVSLYLIDPQTQRAVMRAATGEEGRERITESYEVPIRELGIQGDVLVRGQSSLVHRVRGRSEATGILVKLPESTSAIAVPLRGRENRILGAIEMHSRGQRLTDDAGVMMQILADVLAAAIGNARVLDRLQESLRAERQAGGASAREAWQEWIRASATKGYRYEGSEVVSIDTVLDPGPDEETPAVPHASDGGEELHEAALSLTTARGYPLGQVVAHKSGAWTEDEIALLQSLMEQVEQTLENARLYQNTQRRALREQLSRQITDRIRSAANVEEAMRRAIATLAEVTEAREMVAVIRPERSENPEDAGGGDESYAE